MPKLLLTVLVFATSCCFCIAQHSDTDSVRNPPKERFLKWAPLSWLEADGGLNVSVEYVFPKQKIGVQVEVQPILYSIFNTRGGNGFDEPENLQQTAMPFGIKLRPEGRYYFEGLHAKPYHPHIVRAIDGTPLYSKEEIRSYVAVDFLYKQTWTQRQGNVSISNGGSQPAYWQSAIYTDVKQVIGGDVKLGTVFSISQKNNWWMELYVGIGVRKKRFWYRHLPAGASNPARRALGFPHADRDDTGVASQNMPSFPAGFKLIYRL